MAGGELGAQVAEDAHGQAHVLLDEAEQRLVGLARPRTCARAGCAGPPGRSRWSPTRSSRPPARPRRSGGRWWRRRPCARPVEDGLEDEHVGQVHAALEGVVQAVHVARPHAVAVALDGRGQGVGERREVAGQGQPLGHRPALAVAEGRRVVHVVLEHAGVRRAQDRQRHLVGDGEQGVLEQLERDGVTRRAVMRARLLAAESGLGARRLVPTARARSRREVDDDVAPVVQRRPRARRHHAGRVVLLDDARAGAPGHRDRRAPGSASSQPPVLGPEVDAARSRWAGTSRPGRSPGARAPAAGRECPGPPRAGSPSPRARPGPRGGRRCARARARRPPRSGDGIRRRRRRSGGGHGQLEGLPLVAQIGRAPHAHARRRGSRRRASWARASVLHARPTARPSSARSTSRRSRRYVRT